MKNFINLILLFTAQFILKLFMLFASFILAVFICALIVSIVPFVGPFFAVLFFFVFFFDLWGPGLKELFRFNKELPSETINNFKIIISKSVKNLKKNGN